MKGVCREMENQKAAELVPGKEAPLGDPPGRLGRDSASRGFAQLALPSC